MAEITYSEWQYIQACILSADRDSYQANKIGLDGDALAMKIEKNAQHALGNELQQKVFEDVQQELNKQARDRMCILEARKKEEKK